MRHYDAFGYPRSEKSACGVGFIASRRGEFSHQIIEETLYALSCVEHRGACAADQKTGDGAGIMTDIPFELLGYERGTVAVASLFVTQAPEPQRKLLAIFEDTFGFWDMPIISYREVPIHLDVLGEQARASLPKLLQAIIQRPIHANNDTAFNHMLYRALRKTFTRQRRLFPEPAFFVASLSVNTIVYKALTRSEYLGRFYLDLQNPAYKSRFGIFHRRFSTNTVTSWDKAQPFRLLGHNGEINTIQGNRSWAYSREKTLGLPRNELLTHEGISDSGSLNEIVEALMYRSSLPFVEDAVALIIPPSDLNNSFYKFWSRGMEPWDGPAMVTFSDGEVVGARLDRNGFRPCRWVQTENKFYLASETGIFNLTDAQIQARGALKAGRGVQIDLASGTIDFTDPSEAQRNAGVHFDAHLTPLPYLSSSQIEAPPQEISALFHYTREALDKILKPMVETGSEPIGSMGETARLAILSDQVRSFFDFFYQNFAQVTNPPLDYLREKLVTNLSVYLGIRPNIISQKELIPPPEGLELKSPLLSLGQISYLKALDSEKTSLRHACFQMTFQRVHGPVAFNHQLETIAKQVVDAVRSGISLIILSDRQADWENLPIPVLLVLRRVIIALDKAGLRLRASLIIESGQIYETHHIACTIGFGAAAICPWLSLEMARSGALESKDLLPEQREKNLLKAYESGLLKVMSKMGISVVQSYQSAKLFSIIGLDRELSHLYFRGVPSLAGGLDLEGIAKLLLQQSELSKSAYEAGQPLHNYLYREHNKHQKGEKHAMTAYRSRQIHQALQAETDESTQVFWSNYLESLESESPYHLRHLLNFKHSPTQLAWEDAQALSEILKTFGSGAMSFGAISAESQRDIFLAMREIGGRSNSGEGGENPFYETEGISASIKQVASGRFGVSARYLIGADEFQIKVAQGAKPGEGGQLMATKVDAAIAKARHSLTQVDLISPPPLHDIYSIEDLKELIYELKQLKPGVKISVKLVAGANIGTIAVGVAKAGADIIHISGLDGGTGAASLSSMKHAGLPFEFGLVEVHKALIDNQLRDQIILRIDGGLQTGKDIVLAAILGAQEFDFGKLLLIAEGCVMARVCEKNTCPTGIATHDPKFKSKYKGNVKSIVKLLKLLAQDTKSELAKLGLKNLSAAIGRTDLLEINPNYVQWVNQLQLDLSFLLSPPYLYSENSEAHSENQIANPLNLKLLYDGMPALETAQARQLSYPINNRDRAILATLSGELARREHLNHLAQITNQVPPFPATDKKLEFTFTGSAGQGFGAFLTQGIEVCLYGEANDSVAKSMSGGKIVIKPTPLTRLNPQEDVIIGNGALYGATGGILFVRGRAGDRFAVRNSGAISVVEGTGFHACEYMTQGSVIILGPVGPNTGSGMTGGKIYLLDGQTEMINSEYIGSRKMLPEEFVELESVLTDYFKATNSPTAEFLLKDWQNQKNRFQLFLPIKQL
ncbi:glutamate synthase large subunit [bacterium (Candidatus Blackallbacteria) CG17_big_fil_post_rev_8_21_14_2_50_48_46]|uniref:Glutamate synthase large subunit n=1 Tax=bacterium (Candidatus Blackallbacteria) CG17_big_fil_post_rev_8_21_14_2_50_48_46 TaxID=2014261 RepID=A0A2M7G5S1_9BACT|nr:MAG: glutamate synthase large subunit [bacterium (Candidatus Blackallbacteria) CG18_big_fil_WC_8_21_14_2_50_49_26]PIW17197.1 MAG: glutamate synthase large subunit [bacterium (Candidatus Blackallbacteria) CG17_big_fil_post_rev_8_21_14_2_50_48_46]PIW50988.1 MAG: glutamate synthase large subunit [bacterium (Candidatus Blackallbacteria) CG13_big_fil_rev_8_21_14_2_50_49_14]